MSNWVNLVSSSDEETVSDEEGSDHQENNDPYKDFKLQINEYNDYYALVGAKPNMKMKPLKTRVWKIEQGINVANGYPDGISEDEKWDLGRQWTDYQKISETLLNAGSRKKYDLIREKTTIPIKMHWTKAWKWLDQNVVDDILKGDKNKQNTISKSSININTRKRSYSSMSNETHNETNDRIKRIKRRKLDTKSMDKIHSEKINNNSIKHKQTNSIRNKKTTRKAMSYMDSDWELTESEESDDNDNDSEYEPSDEEDNKDYDEHDEDIILKDIAMIELNTNNKKKTRGKKNCTDKKKMAKLNEKQSKKNKKTNRKEHKKNNQSKKRKSKKRKHRTRKKSTNNTNNEDKSKKRNRKTNASKNEKKTKKEKKNKRKESSRKSNENVLNCDKSKKKNKIQQKNSMDINIPNINIPNIRVPNPNYRCNDCNIQFDTVVQYHNHRRMHKQCFCEYCGKKFTRPDSKMEHILHIHLKKKTYPCRFCGELFFRSSRAYHEKFLCTENTTNTTNTALKISSKGTKKRKNRRL